MSGKSDDKAPVYDLYGVVVHLDTMNATFSGHYVCYVKNTQKKWFKIDDSVVCFCFRILYMIYILPLIRVHGTR